MGRHNNAGSPEAKPPAVILGGVGGALSVTRSLSRHGVAVHVLGNESSLLRASRHCATFVDLGYGDGVQDRWLEWLARGPRGAVVLPVGDDGLEMVANHREWLLSLGYIPAEADDEVLRAMLDKQRTHDLAVQAGIEAPRTISLASATATQSAAEAIGFPCALKPVHSHHFSTHFSPEKLFVVHGPDELKEKLSLTNALGLEMIATEIVPGGDDRHRQYYTYIGRHGQPLCSLTLRKVRQYPIHFGLGTYFVTDDNTEVAREGLRFCQEIGLRGLANIEFKRDVRDGRLKLIECNHRFTAVNELVRVAGLDLATLTYDYLLGLPVHGAAYRSGVRFWRPIEDHRAVREYRRENELSYGSLCHSLLYRKHHYFFDWGDPGPTLYSFWTKLKNRGRRLLRTRT